MKPNQNNSLLHFSLMGLVLALVAGCTQQMAAKKDEKLSDPLQGIQSLVSTKCDDNSQCKTIGIGFMACGGHKSYMTYSSSSTNEKLLKERIASYNKQQEADNNGRPGACIAIPKPTSYCSKEKQVCVTNANRSDTK